MPVRLYTGTMKIQVAVCDNDKNLRDDIIKLVTEDQSLAIAGACSNTGDSIFHIAAASPDVILIGTHNSFHRVIENIARIKNAFPHIHILVLRRYEDDTLIYHCIQAGATACLGIGQIDGLLINTIHELSSDGNKISTSVASWVYKLLHKHDKTDPCTVIHYNLTQREKEIISCTVTGASYKMIADSLHISYETVRTHMKNIHFKLHVSSATELVIKALSEGITD